MRFPTLFIGILALAACNPGKYMDIGRHSPEMLNQLPPQQQWYHPNMMFQTGIPSGNDTYSRGFRDGCQTANSFSGAGLVQFQQFKLDVNLSANDLPYNTGFSDGISHCMFYNDWGPD